MKKNIFLGVIVYIFASVLSAYAQEQNAPAENRGPLTVLQEDLVVERNSSLGGIDLYIRKKKGTESVMLVETTKDPLGKADNYAYRAAEWNTVNGDEIRYLDGKELKSEYSRFSLVSSTVVSHGDFAECFHIYIPQEIHYGYPWSRNGTVKIGKGTFINIRTFSKKYADYTGEFADNPFMFDIAPVPVSAPKSEPVPLPEPEPEPEKPVPLPEPEVTLTDEYNSAAAEKFAELADKGRGAVTYSKGPETLCQDLLESVEAVMPKDAADIVFAIDTTGSMKDDMDTLKNEWVPKLFEQAKKFGDLRLGLLFYRDYNDSYSFKGLPVKYFDFTRYPQQFEKCLATAVIRGNEGGDVPEAVYEALYAALKYYDWRKDASKKIILIGDAEPHPSPRGSKKITQEYVTTLAAEKGIVLDCIIVPDGKGGAR